MRLRPRHPIRWHWDDRVAARWRSSERWAVIAPTALAIALYIGALRNGFAYDDLAIIADNDWVRHGTVLTHALSLPYWPRGNLYRPLTSFTYGLDWLLSGGRPLLFHAVNILWYGIGTALVARVTLRWWPPLAAALAGVVFALQPVHVEAVANVVGRAELLTGAALLGIALVVSASAPLTPVRLLGIGVLATLAVAAKETGAVAPLIAWSTARLRPESRVGDTRRATIAALIGVGLPLLQRVNVLGTLTGDTPHRAFATASHAQAITLALATIPRAVERLLVPRLPLIDYSPTSSAIAHPDRALVAAGAGLVAIAVAVVIAHAWRPSPWTWAAVFSAATFAPVSNLLVHTGVVLADRTLYGPSVGTSILLGAAVAAILPRPLISDSVDPVGALHATRLAAGAVLLAGLAIVATVDDVRTIGVWHDNWSVFTAMRARAPTSYRGPFMLGGYERTHGDMHARAQWVVADSDYRAAIALFDGDPALFYDAAINALELGDTTDALSWLATAVDQAPNEARPRTALILLRVHRGDAALARALLRNGLALEPDQRMWRKMLDSLDRAAEAEPRATDNATDDAARAKRSTSPPASPLLSPVVARRPRARAPSH